MQANVRRNTRYIIILKQIQKKIIFEIGFTDMIVFLYLTVITKYPNVSVLTTNQTLPSNMVTCLVVYTMSTTTFSAVHPEVPIRTLYVKKKFIKNLINNDVLMFKHIVTSIYKLRYLELGGTV